MIAAVEYVSAKPKNFDPTSYGWQSVSAFGGRIGVSWNGLLAQFVYNNGGKSLVPKLDANGYKLEGDTQHGMSTSLAYNFGTSQGGGSQVGVYFASGSAATGLDGAEQKDATSSRLGNDQVTSLGVGGHHYLADGVKLYLGVENVKAENHSVNSVKLDDSVNPNPKNAALPRWSNKATIVSLGSTIEF